MILCIVGENIGFFHSGFFMVGSLSKGGTCARSPAFTFAIKRVDPAFLFGVRRGADLHLRVMRDGKKHGGGYRTEVNKGG